MLVTPHLLCAAILHRLGEDPKSRFELGHTAMKVFKSALDKAAGHARLHTDHRKASLR